MKRQNSSDDYRKSTQYKLKKTQSPFRFDAFKYLRQFDCGIYYYILSMEQSKYKQFDFLDFINVIGYPN